jgi:hypothetical protein
MNEIDQLKMEIEKTSGELSSKLGRLSENVSEIRESFTPTGQIKKHPLLAVGLSVGAGVVVGKVVAGSGPARGHSVLKPLVGFAALMAAGRIGKKEFPEARPHIETIEAVVATKLAHSVAERISDAF